MSQIDILDSVQRVVQKRLGQIKELMAARLVLEESANRFAFRHALTREALYGRLLTRERQSLHGQVVQVIEEIYADSPESHLEALMGRLFRNLIHYAQFQNRTTKREKEGMVNG